MGETEMSPRAAIVRALVLACIVWLAGRGALDAFGTLGGLLAMIVFPFAAMWLVTTSPAARAIETQSQNAPNALEAGDDHPLLREARDGYLAGRWGPYEYQQRVNTLYDLWAAQNGSQRDFDFRTAPFMLAGQWEFDDDLRLVPQTAARRAAAAYAVPPHGMGESDGRQPNVRQQLRQIEDPAQAKRRKEWAVKARAHWQNGTAPDLMEALVTEHVGAIVPAHIPLAVTTDFIRPTTGSNRRMLTVKVRGGDARTGWAIGTALTHADFAILDRLGLVVARLVDEAEAKVYPAVASTKDDYGEDY